MRQKQCSWHFPGVGEWWRAPVRMLEVACVCTAVPWDPARSGRSCHIIVSVLSRHQWGMAAILTSLCSVLTGCFWGALIGILSYSSLFGDQRQIHIHTFGVTHTFDGEFQLWICLSWGSCQKTHCSNRLLSSVLRKPLCIVFAFSGATNCLLSAICLVRSCKHELYRMYDTLPSHNDLYPRMMKKDMKTSS